MYNAGIANSGVHDPEYVGRSPNNPRVLQKFIKTNESYKFSNRNQTAKDKTSRKREFAKSTGIGQHVDLKI